MALAPWNVLAAGKIRSDAEEERRRKTGEKGRTLLDKNWERTEHEKSVCKALEKVASEVGTTKLTAGECHLAVSKFQPSVVPIRVNSKTRRGKC